MAAGYTIARMDEIEGVLCPCGTSRRAFATSDNSVATFHKVHISADAKPHYHKKLTEIYYVLEGQGLIELDGEDIALAIESWLLARNVRIRGPRTIRVNGELCGSGLVYVDPSGSVSLGNRQELSGRGPSTKD